MTFIFDTLLNHFSWKFSLKEEKKIIYFSFDKFLSPKFLLGNLLYRS